MTKWEYKLEYFGYWRKIGSEISLRRIIELTAVGEAKLKAD